MDTDEHKEMPHSSRTADCVVRATGTDIKAMPAMDLLGRLPPELLNIVLLPLLPQHIKSLRLANRKYHNLSSHLLMKTVYFALRPKTLAVFNEIVEHPIFSQTVTELVYDTSLFADQRQRMDEDPDYFRFCLPQPGSCSQEDLNEADREYRALFFEQQRIFDNLEDIRALGRASQKLVCLSTIVYTGWKSLAGDQSLYRNWGVQLADVNEHSCWYVLHGPMSWDVKKACLPLAHRSSDSRTISPVARKVIGSDGNGLKIRNFSFRVRGLVELLQQLPSPNSLAFTGNFMVNLHTIKITLLVREPQMPLITRLSSLLAWARQLHSITLSFRRVDEPRRVADAWFFTPTLHWPHLHTLCLCSPWQINPRTSLSFLGRHSATLKNLRLHELFIAEGCKESWIDIALEMQTLIPALDSLRMSKLSEMGGREFDHLVSVYDDDGEDDDFDPYSSSALDCDLRFAHLKFLVRWILQADRLPSAERERLRTRFEYLRGPHGWHDYSMMGSLSQSRRDRFLRRFYPQN